MVQKKEYFFTDFLLNLHILINKNNKKQTKQQQQQQQNNKTDKNKQTKSKLLRNVCTHNPLLLKVMHQNWPNQSMTLSLHLVSPSQQKERYGAANYSVVCYNGSILRTNYNAKNKPSLCGKLQVEVMCPWAAQECSATKNIKKKKKKKKNGASILFNTY